MPDPEAAVPRAIRAIALAAIRDGDRLLVEEHADPATGGAFARPLGGGVEFGERAEDAVRREIREELGAELTGVRLLHVAETFFSYDGRQRHEHVFLFEAAFADPSLATRQELVGDAGTPGEFTARWRPLADFRRGVRLVPEELLDLLGP